MEKRVTAVLQDHDAVLAWLAQRALAAEEPDRELMRRQFVQCLGTHILAIEKIVKPVLEHCGVADRLEEWLNATAALQSKLAVALTLERDSASFEAALYDVAAHLRRLRGNEGECLMQILTECLSDGELRLLGAELRLSLGEGLPVQELTVFQ